MEITFTFIELASHLGLMAVALFQMFIQFLEVVVPEVFYFPFIGEDSLGL